MNPFRTDDDIHEAFNQAFDATGEATQEKIDVAIHTVQKAAGEVVGLEGLYITGIADFDMQCVTFTFKRPGISQRVQTVIPCLVPDTRQKDDDDDTVIDPPVDDDQVAEQRRFRLHAIAETLDDDQFTKDGPPLLEAINAALDDGEEKFTAEERDHLWRGLPD